MQSTPFARPALTAVALAALLAGCSFIPTYERPAAPVPANFGASADAAVSAGAPAGARAAADIDWKEYFTDPRLQSLIGIALQNNRDLRVSVLNIEQARAQFQIQRSAQFPAVSGIASGTRQPSVVTGKYGNQFQVGWACRPGKSTSSAASPASRNRPWPSTWRPRKHARPRRSAWSRPWPPPGSTCRPTKTARHLAPHPRHARGVGAADAPAAGERRQLRAGQQPGHQPGGNRARHLCAAAPSSACRTRTPWPCCWASRAGRDPLQPRIGPPGRCGAHAAAACGTALRPADAPPRHPPGRGAADRRQRQHRRGAGQLLPAHRPHRQRGHGQQRALGPVQERHLGLLAGSAAHATDLRRRPQPGHAGRPRVGRARSPWRSTSAPSSRPSAKWPTPSLARPRCRTSWTRCASRPAPTASASSCPTCATATAWPATWTCWMPSARCSPPSRAWCRCSCSSCRTRWRSTACWAAAGRADATAGTSFLM